MSATDEISVTLPPDLTRAVRDSIEAGEYTSPGEAVSDALRLWQRRREEDAGRLDAIRARIGRSLDDPRPSLSTEQVRAHLNVLFAEARDGRDGA